MSDSTIEMGSMQAQKVSGSIPKSLKVTWGTGALGISILLNTVASLALFYMVGILKIEPALAGVLIFVTKLFDLATDPFVGGWSDRLSTGKSRRRPFLLAGAVVAPISFALIFATPIFPNPTMTAAYIFVAMLIYTMGYTLFNVPYMSMPAEMTDDYHERSSIHSYRAVFVSIGGILAFAVAPLLLEALGRDKWSAYAIMGAAGGVIIFLSMMTSWAGTASARFTLAAAKPPKLLDEVKHVFSDRHFIRLLAVKASQLLGVASMQAAMVFFVVNALGRDFKLLSMYGLTVGIVSIISAPIVVRLSEKIGKSKTYILAAISFSAVAASWIFAQPDDPTWMFMVRAGFIAFAATGNIVMAMSMLTDIINHAAKSSGIRREGVYTSFYSFVEKFTFAFGPLIIGIALSVAGFDEKLPAEQLQAPAIRNALLLGMSFIPAVMGVLSIFLLSGYKLREQDLKS